MANEKVVDVIILGGSYSGLSAGMALGRALRNVLIIDSGKPCNRQTPHSHNFITQDGKTPKEISETAKAQVKNYKTVKFQNGLATSGKKTAKGFEISLESGEIFSAKKLIFATGIKDLMPDIAGLAECWGISVLHCPYCHGYEVRNEKTAILGNGDFGFEFSKLISNWTKDLKLFTNGPCTLTAEQTEKVKKNKIEIIETEIEKVEHKDGYLQTVYFKDGSKETIKAMYARLPFVQQSEIPQNLGCELAEGYIKIDPFQKTSVPGILACGDAASPMRSLANSVAMGTLAGVMINKELIEEEF
ncbi:pyridine nucleotide-disulfide oxidoreductase [Sphingobacteriaceae bacterium]|nr:pyridine nucleotide-disulfide oxidoreductase [Sphingobacteriaceae bacterium]